MVLDCRSKHRLLRFADEPAMQFGHEKLIVYQRALDFLAIADELASQLRHDVLLSAINSSDRRSQSWRTSLKAQANTRDRRSGASIAWQSDRDRERCAACHPQVPAWT
jgi:hypothetical protein